MKKKPKSTITPRRRKTAAANAALRAKSPGTGLTLAAHLHALVEALRGAGALRLSIDLEAGKAEVEYLTTQTMTLRGEGGR